MFSIHVGWVTAAYVYAIISSTLMGITLVLLIAKLFFRNMNLALWALVLAILAGKIEQQ